VNVILNFTALDPVTDGTLIKYVPQLVWLTVWVPLVCPELTIP